MDAINQGIGWVYVYLDDTGAFKQQRFSPYEILPFWRDEDYTKLDMVVRIYDVNVKNANINRNVNMLDGTAPVIAVPAPRFYDVIQINDGKTSGQEAGGYKTVSGFRKVN
ncbi:MAG TPA: phage portal protein [Candidatus Avacidaminococcus intestinavium]|uniref:Phage portal protein n=1 Tax=Candidatus Avacidaminococcus intestinavium TaxID=2840684 RepID=A0A9D1MRA6_9FIRM|nr:phage portal protein [Candidatus Avacidaminococcus intestinavium]